MNWTKIKQFFATMSLEKLIPCLIILVIGLILIKLVLRIFDKAMERSKLEKTAYSFLRSIIKIVLLFLLILIVCSKLGINVTSLVALLSVVTLAISLAVQNALANIVSGIILLTSKPFKVDDYVQIGQQSGTVKELSMVYTKIVTLDNRCVQIPNSNVTATEITNYTVLGQRRVELTVSAAYSADPEVVKEALLAASNQPCTLFTPAPRAFVTSYGDNAVAYKLWVWANSSDYWDTYILVTESIYSEFRKRDIEMTYPHLNVHLDKQTICVPYPAPTAPEQSDAT